MNYLLQKNNILFVFLFLASALSAQDRFDFNYDYAEFKYDSATSYLEIYYSFLPNSFYSNKTDSSLVISGILNITLEDTESGRNIMNKNWEISEEFKDSAEYLDQGPLLGVVGLKMPEGKYDFQIMLKDIYKTENFKSYNEEINISQDHYSSLAISDIQLASKILNDKVNENSIFYKNTLEVYPNPASIYTQNYPILYYYCELYNLNAIASDSLLLRKRVNDSKGNNVYQKSRKLISHQKSIVDVGFVNLKDFPTDSYNLLISIEDENENKLTESKKRFFLINPAVKREESFAGIKDYMSSEFGVLSEEECDDMFEKSKIIASSNEIDQYEILDSLSSKREFLFNFWLRRDDQPQTPLNEFKITFFSRINIAFERYSTVTTPGYNTDRGRVYARFGEPDEIERHPNETDSKPYEIWFYNQIEGGVYFVFGDYTGFNNYELLHSTLRGELQDPQWMRRLRTN